METTSLYVELIIIGLETLTWITSFSILFTDIEHISVIKDIFEKLPASIFVLGIMYVLGLVFDRFADIVFKKTERKIRNSSGLKAKSSILIWKKSNQEDFYNFTRSRIRILRASSINLPLVMLSIALNIYKYYNEEISFLVFVVIIGVMLSWYSNKGYRDTIKNFYDKAKILEEELKKAEHSSRRGS